MTILVWIAIACLAFLVGLFWGSVIDEKDSQSCCVQKMNKANNEKELADDNASQPLA
jgi:hypothetical protein